MFTPSGNRLFTASVLLLCGLALEAPAQPADSCPNPNAGFELADPPPRDGQPLVLEADQGRFEQQVFSAEGNVVLTRADQQLRTPTIQYNQASGQLELPEALDYSDSVLELRARKAEYNLVSEAGAFDEVRYGLAGAMGNGSASRIAVSPGQPYQLDDVRYTTCAGDDPDWVLSAPSIRLDTESGRGYASNATLRLGKLPILWAPWLTFPLDDRRQSGFLYPNLATSNDNGFDVSVPYYWNIAPSMDATITPRLITDRGLVLGTEYRWLTRQTRGLADVQYLHDDDRTGEERYRYQLRHLARFAGNWQTSVELDRVSDDFYFEDFGDGLAETSRQFLASRASLTGFGRYWRLSMTADDYQVLDRAVAPSREPYQRLPRIVYQLDQPLGDSLFDLRLDSELVRFDRDNGATGTRLDLFPQLSWNWRNDYAWVKPALAWRYTGYDLDELGSFSDSSPDRSLPLLSVDSGLLFERTLASGARQTLEPRLYYLYVPYEDQSDLPDFDTAPLTVSFGQLFMDNRFSGGDRQGDANRVTLGLTSRTFDAQNGREAFNINLAQTFFLEDREVSLDNTVAGLDADASAFLAEVNQYWTPSLFTRYGLQYDWEDGELDLAYTGINWQGRNGARVAFSYRFRKDRVDQIDTRLSLPIGNQWRLLARWNQDLDQNDALETLLGVEYRNCCWALRVFGRQYLRNRLGEDRTGIYLELELTGLGSVGRRPYPLFAADPYYD